ncbi:MAG: hypothetical protein H6718_09430 [Polyangiaceae bacterium]|nr:hypothetical protein [Myxococcales bacterium]MCB9585608.1 hypothetical protein [Polyangiaceae bacterium]MCB9606377.1 hypothetical protein [Polyangiaceae bacterium]
MGRLRMLVCGLALVGCGAGNTDQLQRLQADQAQLRVRQDRLARELEEARAQLQSQSTLREDLQRTERELAQKSSELAEQSRRLDELSQPVAQPQALLASLADNADEAWSCAVVCLESIDCKRDTAAGKTTAHSKRTVHRAMGTGKTAGKAYIRALDACRDGATPYHSIECRNGRIQSADATLDNSCIRN